MEDLLSKIEQGVDIQELKMFQAQYTLTYKQMAHLLAISEKSYYNLLKKEARLNAHQSGQFLKVVQVFAEGEEALMSREAFLEWMEQPHWYFDQRKPFDLLDNSIGADAVIAELIRTKYGVLS